jgi:cation transport ATPase
MNPKRKHPINAENVFLVDAVGALVTATLLSQVLARYQTLFGMPEDILQMLASIAMLFSIYSFLCHFYLKRNKSSFLKIIAILNTLYCIGTLVIVIYLLGSITWLGLIYFISEIAIVLILVRREWKISIKVRQS